MASLSNDQSDIWKNMWHKSMNVCKLKAVTVLPKVYFNKKSDWTINGTVLSSERSEWNDEIIENLTIEMEWRIEEFFR